MFILLHSGIFFPWQLGHSGFAGREQEYLIPMGLGMVVVIAAFEEHPDVV